MSAVLRHALSSLLVVAATNASAGVITQDGVVFTSSHIGNVLTLEIDAARRSGGWAGATAIDALSLKTVGSFSGVSMTSSTGAAWSLLPSELNARGCASAKGKSSASGMTRLCYTGAGVTLADDMVFTFTFTGTPSLSAPHLKVHFVDANGSKVGSLLSLDFPWQAASAPAGQAGSTGSTGSAGSPDSTASTGGQAGASGSQAGTAGPAPELVPAPALNQPATQPAASNDGLPVDAMDEDSSEVPEPRTLTLMTAGLALLCVTRRRRK